MAVSRLLVASEWIECYLKTVIDNACQQGAETHIREHFLCVIEFIKSIELLHLVAQLRYVKDFAS